MADASSMDSSLGAYDILQNARALEDELRARADEIDQLRRLPDDLVEGLKQIQAGILSLEHFGAESQLRDRVTGNFPRDGHGRNQVGGNQDNVLRHLCIGDAAHSTEYLTDGYLIDDRFLILF